MGSSQSSKMLFRTNNFDLLRLFAASQVAILHSLHIMDVSVTSFVQSALGLLYMFPGVPIFFFVSGFLISKSFESNSQLEDYASNRILRLFPALILAVTLSFILIFASGYAFETDAGFVDWAMLYIAKISVIQFYNPEFMRAYGDGVLNGSLWTITVELQFYVLVPVIYAAFRLRDDNNWRLILLILIFFGINRAVSAVPYELQSEIAYKLVKVSFLPWFYMFLVGVFFQRNFDRFHKILAGRFIYLLPCYLIVGLIAVQQNANFGNNVNPLFFALLAPLIFSFAYSFPTLAQRTTRGNDFSYGIYIYHMPVINCMVYLGLTGSFAFALTAMFLTLAIAITSWFVVERNCLKLKNHPFNPIYKKAKAW
ncbi:acyltransferase [Allohahella marinimesophila]|uniref:Acyltransferase 3 domain-containing protein n=1 Tax=Allohahella marinimesophila TaxID=1054972 RepID=A0ABP7Q7Y9_9GAMM